MAEERTRRRNTGRGRRRGSSSRHSTPAAPKEQPVAVAELEAEIEAAAVSDEGAVDLSSLYRMDNKELTGAAKALKVEGTRGCANRN